MTIMGMKECYYVNCINWYVPYIMYMINIYKTVTNTQTYSTHVQHIYNQVYIKYK